MNKKNREKIYVCVACGKTANKPVDFNDVSCALNAVLVWKDSLEYVAGRVIKADAVSDDEKE